jgi:hypothetical protein
MYKLDSGRHTSKYTDKDSIYDGIAGSGIQCRELPSEAGHAVT